MKKQYVINICEILFTSSNDLHLIRNSIRQIFAKYCYFIKRLTSNYFHLMKKQYVTNICEILLLHQTTYIELFPFDEKTVCDKYLRNTVYFIKRLAFDKEQYTTNICEILLLHQTTCIELFPFDEKTVSD